MEPIRVLIADDHSLFRDGMRALLNSVVDATIVGEATTGSDVIVQAAVLQPDVILMDLQMPGINGIEATRQIIQTSPHIGILVLTMFEDDDSVFAAMQAGARGYLLKGVNQTQLLLSIRAVADGEAIFSPTIARRLMHYFNTRKLVVATPILPELTNREREILTLIAHGYTNAEITQRLFLSPKTVRNHISNIFSKLQVADRAQAILRAQAAGLDRMDG